MVSKFIFLLHFGMTSSLKTGPKRRLECDLFVVSDEKKTYLKKNRKIINIIHNKLNDNHVSDQKAHI